MSLFTPTRAALAAALSLTTLAASAAEWRDFSLAYTYGTRFKEPYVADGGNIAKNIVTARYVDGDSWGGNFFNADVMKSDAVDNKATEVFVMYRRLFDFGKISQRDLSFGPVKSVGATVGFDWNTKNSPEYGSRTRTLVAGPTLVMDVPEGFLNVSVLAIWESNRPTAANLPERYWYKTPVCWGDIDTHGFAILDQLRGYFPAVASFLMDRQTLLAHCSHWGEEPDPARHDLMRLTPEETAVYDDLRFDRHRPRLRLEQERVGFGWLCNQLACLRSGSLVASFSCA